MAALHINKAVVLSVDLKDFFTSIKELKVRQVFIGLGINETAARTLSELCTYKAFVPQGALTSPKVANMITAATFGPEIKRYCDEKNLVVSIYADDVTISSANRDINVTEILTDITSIIQRHGFRINRTKTKVMFSTRRQYVCGVVVNQKPNLIKKERKRLRAIVHNIGCNGLEAEANKSGMSVSQFEHHVKGKVNWFRQLNPELGNNLMAKLNSVLAQNSPTETQVTTEVVKVIETSPVVA